MSWDWDGVSALEMFSISRDRVIHTREEPPGSFTVRVDAILALTGDDQARIEVVDLDGTVIVEGGVAMLLLRTDDGTVQVVESRPSGRTIHRVVWESE